LKTAFALLRGFFFILFILLVLAASFQYLYCPVYIFPEPKPFSGDKIYNPYADMDSTGWKKANFHLHTRKWGGLTNGHNTTDQEADTTYRFLHYDIIGISDYQSINYYREKEADFIPTYEHGYMVMKNHQNVMGAKKVSWLDYPFPQTLSNKQYIIDRLKEDPSAFVAIAHPKMRNSYPPNDFRFLSDYDCIEVFDRIIYSVPHWDTALSTGHPAFATSVDDNHDIEDVTEVAMNYTLVNAESVKSDAVLSALKRGRMIAVEMYKPDQLDFAKKHLHSLHFPIINKISFENNHLIISSNDSISYIDYIGQNGVIKQTIKATKEAVYDFKPEDTYIRTDIHFPDSTIYHLNPVFRYSGTAFEAPKPIIDETSTMIHRILFYISLLALLYIAYIKFKK
jgi:hypothetical protein